MAAAISPQNAARIERWHGDRIKPLKATQAKLAGQIEASKEELDRRRNQPKRLHTEQIEKRPSIPSGNALEAIRGIATRKGVRFLVATAIGPGITASVVAAGLRQMLRDREAIRHLEPSRVADLRRGIEALAYSGEAEAKYLKHWQGREDRLAARLELDRNNPDIGKQYLNPNVRQAAEKAEMLGSLINQSERHLRENPLQLPSNLEPMRGQLELINARCMSLGMPPMTRQGLDALSYKGLSSAINDDPALRQMSQAGSQWVNVPVRLFELALGKLKILGLGLGR